ncbi:MAG: hypothetical protein WCQ57_16455 [Verrucomicrobiota bacterium]
MRSAAKSTLALKSFYDLAPDLATPNKPATWNEVAALISDIYRN